MLRKQVAQEQKAAVDAASVAESRVAELRQAMANDNKTHSSAREELVSSPISSFSGPHSVFISTIRRPARFESRACKKRWRRRRHN